MSDGQFRTDGPFRTEVPVRFNDVDHAQVVYYPKYLDYCHAVFEQLMEAGLGRPYARVVIDDGVGYPAVNVEVDYTAPARFGDVLDVAVTCDRLGSKSVTLRYHMTRRGDGVACCTARITVVCIDMAAFSGVPIPNEHRRFFEALSRASASAD